MGFLSRAHHIYIFSLTFSVGVFFGVHIKREIFGAVVYYIILHCLFILFR